MSYRRYFLRHCLAHPVTVAADLMGRATIVPRGSDPRERHLEVNKGHILTRECSNELTDVLVHAQTCPGTTVQQHSRVHVEAIIHDW